MTNEVFLSQIAIQIAIQVAGVSATFAAVKVGLLYLEKRVDKIEGKVDDLPDNYVPRSEVELGLNALRDTAEKTHSLVEAFFAGGRTLHAAADDAAAVMGLLEAIAREEGFYATGTRPNRNHNPGDLEFGRFAEAHGATHGDPRFAVFPDAATGFAAMRALFLAPGYKDLTVAQALNKWAPPVENATNSYIANVCHWTGLHPDDPIEGKV